MSEVKTNWFVRILIVLLCAFVVVISAVNFFSGNAITGGLIIMICILVVLVLSESFDNFSIAKIITLNRDIKNKNAENFQLRAENVELRNQVITITTNTSQKQVSSIINNVGVKEVTTMEKNKEEAEEAEFHCIVDTAIESTNPVFRSKRNVKYEDASINKLLKDKDLNKLSLLRNAKFTQNIDQTATFEPIYDGYLKYNEAEIFIEVAIISNTTIMWRDKLYIMLNKIKSYNDIKNTNAYLYLVLVNDTPPQNDSESTSTMIQIRERYEKYFEPAITSGLLKIVEYDKDSLIIE